MALFSIEIDDADISRVLDAMAVNFGRPDTVSNPSFNPSLPESESNPRTIDNPETKAVFANRMVREILAARYAGGDNIYNKLPESKQEEIQDRFSNKLIRDLTITDPEV